MNIYVGNLSGETTEDELRKAFEAFGQVMSVKILKDSAAYSPQMVIFRTPGKIL